RRCLCLQSDQIIVLRNRAIDPLFKGSGDRIKKREKTVEGHVHINLMWQLYAKQGKDFSHLLLLQQVQVGAVDYLQSFPLSELLLQREQIGLGGRTGESRHCSRLPPRVCRRRAAAQRWHGGKNEKTLKSVTEELSLREPPPSPS
ncbi:hypothetical protein AAFF_G00049900, partial [Aldrovandia affinis]